MTGRSAAMARMGGLRPRRRRRVGREPFSIAVHPKGGKLAVGFDDTTAVEVYDAASLKRLYAANTEGISGGNLGNVAWSADGARLYAGGLYQLPRQLPVMIWQDEGRGKRAEAPLSQSTIMQLLPCGAGIAAGAADPAFGLIAADGGKRVWQEGVTADMRDKKRDAFASRRTAGACASAWGRARKSRCCSILPPSGSPMRRKRRPASRRPKPLASPSAIGRTPPRRS